MRLPSAKSLLPGRSSTCSARLTNPAGARAQVVGVYSPELVRTIAEVLTRLGAHRAYVVHGGGGIDELSPVGLNLVAEVVNGEVRERELIQRRSSGFHAAPSRSYAAARPHKMRRRFATCLQARTGAAETPFCSTLQGRSPLEAMPTICGKGSGLRARPSTPGAAGQRLELLIAFSRETVTA